MKSNLITTALLAALALAMGMFVAACEVEDDTDGCPDGGCIGEGEGEGEGEGSGEGEGEGEGQADVYRWVRICSITDFDTKNYPGPDIDAVQVCTSTGGNCFWATDVGPNNIQGTQNAFSDPNEALGQPDTTTIELNKATSAFVSIGTSGHYLILGFDRDVLPGYRMTVFEVGKSLNPNAQNEPSEISVSFQSSNSGDWVRAAQGSDEFEFEVPDSNGGRATCP